jgi:hypothetical protein
VRLTERGLQNGLWLGLKPAVQFLAGATLLRQNPALAAEFYTLILLWTAGYEVCALLADRQIVVLANQARTKPLVAFRSLMPLLFGIGAVLAAACAVVGSQLTEATFFEAFAMCSLGAVAGVAEGGFWAAAADAGRFRSLAGVRLLSTSAFLALLVAAAQGFGSVAWALASESAVVTILFAMLHGGEIATAKPVRLPAVRVFGFYLVKIVSYLNRFVESWWAVAGLSGVALAAFRVGLAPKSFLMMAFTALVQPTLFRVSARDWTDRQRAAQREVMLAADLLVLLASAIVVFTSVAAILLPKLVEPYQSALGVAWISLAFFCGPGWFGMLASSLLTNWGAIRLPILATVGSVLARSGAYGLLLMGERLGLLSMALIAEGITAAAQNAFWRKALAANLWTLDGRFVCRVVGRTCITLGSLLFWLTTEAILSLVVLSAAHALVAAEAATELFAASQSSRRTPRAERTRSRSSSE